MNAPQNSHEFLQHWRQYGGDKCRKYSYLIKIGGAKLSEIFNAEMGLLDMKLAIDVLFELKCGTLLTLVAFLSNLANKKRY